jgi:hypothetical protein
MSLEHSYNSLLKNLKRLKLYVRRTCSLLSFAGYRSSTLQYASGAFRTLVENHLSIKTACSVDVLRRLTYYTLGESYTLQEMPIF